MPDAEVEAKCRALASNLLTPAQLDQMLDRLWHLEQVEDIAQLMRLIRI